MFTPGTFSFTANTSCPPPAARIAAEGVAVEPVLPTGERNIKFYPNPTRGRFNLQLTNVAAQKLKIDIINASGQLIAQKTVPVMARTALLNVEFNLLNEVPGIYLVKVAGSEGVRTEKLVIQR